MNGEGIPARAVDYSRVFTQAIDRLHAEGRYRVSSRSCATRACSLRRGASRAINGPKPITVWCSNDYLAMGQHPKVIARWRRRSTTSAPAQAARATSAATRIIMVDLEAELADLHGKEGALLFTSGYVSNEATLATLAKVLPGCIVFSDELNHASMIAGIRNSGCEKQVWRHTTSRTSRNCSPKPIPPRPS